MKKRRPNFARKELDKLASAIVGGCFELQDQLLSPHPPRLSSPTLVAQLNDFLVITRERLHTIQLIVDTWQADLALWEKEHGTRS